MRYKVLTLVIAAALAAAATLTVACGTMCTDLTGIQKVACEATAFKVKLDVVVKGDPTNPAKLGVLATLDAMKPALDPKLAAKIGEYEARWPAIDATLTSAVNALNAGSVADYQTAIANAMAFYVQLSAVVVQSGGKPLPGLPGVATVTSP